MSDGQTTEEFRAVPGFPEYEVSNLGRVRSCKTGPWQEMVQVSLPTGYKMVTLHHDKRGWRFYVHRLVLQVFVGPCPPGMECRHLDGDPANNALSNLCWGTKSENCHDRIRHGRYRSPAPHGVDHPNAKLTDEVVRLARCLHRDGRSLNGLAKQFGVTMQAMSAAIKGKTWKHVN